MVIRELTPKEQQIFQQRYSIPSTYQKFLETGSIGDHAHTGRSSTITEDKVQEIEQILDNECVSSVA